MKKFLFSLVALLALSISVVAQERQVEVNVTPSRFESKLGGKLWLDMGNRVRVVGDVDYSSAYTLFQNPTDTVNATGTMWLYLTSTDVNKKANTRPFVFGGVTQTMLVQREDVSTGNMGFGFTHFRNSGFEFSPTIEYNTNDFLGNLGNGINPIVGNGFKSTFYFKIPVSKQFRVNLAPYAGRREVNGVRTFYYGGSIGVGRVF